MEVQDAYQEYVRTRNEGKEVDPLVTIEMPASEVASIYRVILDSIEAAKDLPLSARKRWEQILRKLARGIEEVL